MIQWAVSKIGLWYVMRSVTKMFVQQERQGGEGKGGRKSRTRDYKNPNDSVSNAMGILGSAIKLVNSSRHTLAYRLIVSYLQRDHLLKIQ